VVGAAGTAQHRNAPRGKLADVWRHPGLLRLNLGVFVLHTVQLAMWVAVPAMLVQAGLTKDHHWQVYLPAVVLFSWPWAACLRWSGGVACARAAGRHCLVLLVQVGLGAWRPAGTPTLWVLGLLMFVFFCGFNALEASQPSLVSRMAPPRCAGAALGSYNTCSRWACLPAAHWAARWSNGRAPPVLFAPPPACPVAGADLCAVGRNAGCGH
jgi:hypothetical protein